MAQGDFLKAKVKVKRQFYPKGEKVESGDYAILSVEIVETIEGEPITNEKWGTISIKGIVCAWEYGTVYTLIAKEGETNNFGTSYEIVSFFEELDLTEISNQKIFLKRVLTDIQVANLFSTLENPLQTIMEHDIQTLCTVKGIGATTAEKIISKYEDQKDYSQAYVALDNLGLSTKMIQKLCKHYGNPNVLVQKIQENPYIVADEVNGIGWAKADEIALKSGIGEFSNKRIVAYIKYSLDKQANEFGDSYVYTNDMIDYITATLGEDIADDMISKALRTLMEKKEIWSDDNREKIALTQYRRLEFNIAKDLVRLNEGQNDFKTEGWKDVVKNLEKEQGWKFGAEQMIGIEATMESNVVLITGYGGVGKSTIVNAMNKALSTYFIGQCALSGRAGVNLTMATGMDGQTIHRLLGYNPAFGYAYNKNSQLPYDIIILDEISMVDAGLFYRLVQAIRTGSKLIMLGDYGQLEAIGVGNVLMDLINCGKITHINLTEIHRQAKKSAIALDSIQIWKGKQVIDKGFVGKDLRGELKDLLYDITEESRTTADRIMNHFEELYNKVDTIMDLQVIVPIKNRGECCTYKLNNRIQKYIRDIEGLSEDDDHVVIGEDDKAYRLYVGDKVMNVKNNYNTTDEVGSPVPIMNGNQGIIKKIIDNEMLIVEFERLGEVVIPKECLSDIELAYACTTHKLQGSGIKYVICGLDSSHYVMLNKEMLYTMMTRAKKYCVIVGENSAIRQACANSGVKNKKTFLCDLLKYNYEGFIKIIEEDKKREEERQAKQLQQEAINWLEGMPSWERDEYKEKYRKLTKEEFTAQLVKEYTSIFY